MSQTVFPPVADSRMVLAANFRKFGNGPDFWDAYRHLLDWTARSSGMETESANRLALMAQELGIVKTAQLL
ncbi:MAG TPA: hypothetical protein VEP93_01205 [Variovorax sp.]|nr:hypothetical protein [Variovorax sp.]